MAVLEKARIEETGPARDPRLSRLVHVVRQHSLLSGTNVKLSSGAESSFYFNMKPTLFTPDGADVVADLVLDQLQRDDADLIGGLEMGAVPIVANVVLLSSKRHAPVKGFFVRKVAKGHGTRKLIEGLTDDALLAGKRALIVDDVTTTGMSVLKAVDAARAAGLEVGTVVTVVDRLEGAEANLIPHGLKLVALTTARDYGIGG